MGDGLTSTITESHQPGRATRDHGAAPSKLEAAALREVLQALRRIRHGQVQIHIQDGRVVQIDHTEKLRLRGG